MPALRNPLSDHRLHRDTSRPGTSKLSRPWRDLGARPEWWSVGVALTLTTLGFSVSVVSVRVLRSTLFRAPPATRERVDLVRLEPPTRPESRRVPPPEAAPRDARPIEASIASPSPAPVAAAPSTAPTSDSIPVAPDSARDAAVVDASAPPGPPASSLAGPRAVAAVSGLRFPGFVHLDSAALDSVRRLRDRHEAQAWRTWRMPKEVVEAEWRRESERIAARAADKRPWTVTAPRASGPVGVTRAGAGAGVSIPLPLFAKGPSRKQRMRDSVIHAGNVERLQRIFERARRDSIVRASALTP